MNEATVIALIVVGAILAFPLAIALTVPFGWLVSLKRYTCPDCDEKKLKQVNFVKCNPPPAYGCFICEGCGSKFVKYSNETEFRPQKEAGVRPELFKQTAKNEA